MRIAYDAPDGFTVSEIINAVAVSETSVKVTFPNQNVLIFNTEDVNYVIEHLLMKDYYDFTDEE